MNVSKKENWKAVLAVLLGNSIFGFSFLFSKLALQITLPAVLIAIRFTSAFVVLNVLVLVGKLIRRKDGTSLISFSLKGKSIKYLLLLALFQPVIYYIAENYGILFTSSAYSGVIIATIPIIGVMLDLIIMRSKVRPVQIIAAVASIVGVIITTLDATSMTASLKGTVLLLIAAFSSAMFYVLSKKAGTEYNAIERTYAMFGIGTVFYVIFALIQCRGMYDQYIGVAVTNGTFWICILYLAIVSSVIAFLLLNYGSDNVSVSKASLFANFSTVISVIAGVFVLGEAFTWQQVVGMIIILVSVYLAK